ncbi:oxygenase MpaB family protein [Dermatobacter hominis]|uniref:oxygenase MpaB family protein n=1 Tax=Dermatobacter hominis TaxID=2884263 RepID=UPI001D102C79|nr:oxygenase MpaB family protein [Dermatobacter hominis]UDY37972.1 DUF2236 domain-containing protein [Dermatobacter hominis]
MALVTHEVLDEMSGRGDPPADALILEHAEWSTTVLPSDIVAQLARRLRFADDDCSPVVNDYLQASPEPPIPVDRERVELGAQFFQDHSLEIGSALFCGSLPAGYASPRGARVLTLTGRLTSDLVRRVMETAQMILNVTRPGGLVTGTGCGYQDTRRVRLMHAAVRHFILEDPAVPRSEHLPVPAHGWCSGWGVPINQEDLLGGMLTFTVTVFEVLDKLGVEYQDEHAEAYLHLWCVVGSLLGIDPSILPSDRQEAGAAADLIRSRQLDHSRDGRELTRALIEALEGMVALPPLRGVVPAAVRWFVGPDVATLLGVGPSPWGLVLDGPVTWTSRLVHVDERSNQVMRVLLRQVGGAAIDGFMTSNRGHERPDFDIPEELSVKLRRGPKRFYL